MCPALESGQRDQGRAAAPGQVAAMWPRVCFRYSNGTDIVSPWCNMAQLMETSLRGDAVPLKESRYCADGSMADVDLEDLIHSWQRLGNPDLRRLAVRLVRMLGEDPSGEHVVDARRPARSPHRGSR